MAAEAWEPVTRRVPEETVVEVWLAEPAKVSTPAPALVRTKPPPTAPPREISPEPPMVVAEPRVTAPAKEAAVPAEFRRAPPEERPEPSRVRASEPIAWPLRSRTAPEVTAVAPAVVPRALALASLRVPAETVTRPVWPLLPESVTVPEPTLERSKAPASPPARVKLPEPPIEAFAPKVSRPAKEAEVAEELTTAPPEEMPEPLMVTDSAPRAWPLRSRTAPAATVVAPVVLPRAEAPPTARVPTSTEVEPE